MYDVIFELPNHETVKFSDRTRIPQKDERAVIDGTKYRVLQVIVSYPSECAWVILGNV